MARVKCRCGEAIEVDREAGPERVVCPRCRARIRVRRADGPGAAGDGLIRFHCPCGRRLKVRAADRPEAGRCPDCGRVVPVPQVAMASASITSSKAPKSPGAGVSNVSFAGDGGARTEEMGADDVARLQRWAARHGVIAEGDATSAVPPPILPETPYSPPPALRVEAGLRICPRCGRPLHMSAVTCRACGAPTPKG